MLDKSRLYRVKHSGRIVRLTQYLGEGRWLCTDDAQKCDPCYNEPDLEPWKPTHLSPGDVVRMPSYRPDRGYRVWKVSGVHLGGLGQESTYALKPLDESDNEEIHVPCIMLETHPAVEVI